MQILYPCVFYCGSWSEPRSMTFLERPFILWFCRIFWISWVHASDQNKKNSLRFILQITTTQFVETLHKPKYFKCFKKWEKVKNLPIPWKAFKPLITQNVLYYIYRSYPTSSQSLLPIIGQAFGNFCLNRFMSECTKTYIHIFRGQWIDTSID